jgi:CRISPR/Cas system CMR subunit Cmr4 (Cas7 group RAMP superfamily)
VIKIIVLKLKSRMKTINSIKDLFGMKYEDMAMLLQISKSQWGMYVTGKRNLPLAAKQKLANMLAFNNDKVASKVIVPNKLEIRKTQMVLQKLYSDNTNQQAIVKQKLITIAKKQKTADTAIDFITYLESQREQQTEAYQNLLKMIKQNAQTELKNNSLALQTQLQIKLKTLVTEEKQIFKEMKKLS